MTRIPVILIADCSPSDTELADMLLRQAYPHAHIRSASDAVAFAEALADATPDVAIVAPKLSWAASDRVISMLRGRAPQTSVILFGHESDLAGQITNPGLAIDGIARKSSAGYIALAGIVGDALARAAPDPAVMARSVDIDDVPLPAFVVGADGRLTHVNVAFEQFAGMPSARLLASSLEAHLAESGTLARCRDLAGGAGESAAVTTRMRNAAGDTTSVRVRRLQDGSPAERYVGCLLSEPAPVAVAPPPATTAASDIGYQELRDIALVFSHDLKEPIQQIGRLARRVADQGEGAPHPRTAGTMQQVLDCANRASDLVDSMLEYFAVSARESAPVLVDLNRCLERALDNLRNAIDEADADIVADSLPSVIGDEYQMLHLVQNLVSNAVKFRGRERPRIRISVEAQGNEWLLAFRDNGIGIAQPFLGRVFEMGQRLHTREEYPGTGVGLTLCKRIVERHGGHIWAESNEAGGCTFFVRLPRTSSQVARFA